MRAAVLLEPATMQVREVGRPAPAPHEVLVRVQAVGLCGTDVHIYEGHANYHTDREGRPIPLRVHPQILGHEIAGVIEETGRAVADLRRGERVVVDQGRTCVGEHRVPRCEYCQTGDSHQCDFYQEHGITGLPGGLAEYIAVPSLNAVRIRSEVEPAIAAMAEPLGCVIHALDLVLRAPARYRFEQRGTQSGIRSIVVCGGGPAGLLFVQVLRDVIGFDGLLMVSEPNPIKRALAERFGAEVVDPTVADLGDRVRDRTHGRRAELLVDASGAGSVFEQIPGLLRKQGSVLLYGHGHAGVDLSVLNNIQFLEPTLVSPVGASGGFEPDGRPSVYQRALELIETGRVSVRDIVTHRYDSLDSIPDAFRHDYRMPEYVKGVFTPKASILENLAA